MDTTTDIDVASANQSLLKMSAIERLRWSIDNFGPRVVLLSSMQKTSSVLMHMFHRLGLENEILFVDTGFHFHETLRLRDEFMRRYRLNIVTLYPELTPEDQEKKYGKKLYLFGDCQPECCRLRKEEPFIGYMRQHQHRVVVNGLRASEGGKRSKIAALAVDPRFDGYALHPLVDWTDEQLEEYLHQFGVLVHPLHAQSYPSIGCACCTTPVAPGEDPRAGRWRHLRQPEGKQPVYCGINFSEGGGI